MKVKEKHLNRVKDGIQEGVKSGWLEDSYNPDRIFDTIVYKPYDNKKTERTIFKYFYLLGYNNWQQLLPNFKDDTLKQWLIDNKYLIIA